MQQSMVELILVLVVLSNLMLLGSSRLTTSIQVVATQGMVLGVLPLFLAHHGITGRLVIFVLIAFSLKGLVFPRLLTRSLREADVRHDIVLPWIGYSASVLLGVVLLALSLWIGSRFEVPTPQISPLLLSVALSTIFIGLFVIISRIKALTQVVGYLVMENGIFILGVALAQEQPLLVEMGVLLDVFVGVFVMGIAIFHISREFDHIDVDQMTLLKD